MAFVSIGVPTISGTDRKASCRRPRWGCGSKARRYAVEPASADVVQADVQDRRCWNGSGLGEAVEGEWFGFEMSFSGKTGERMQIPEHYIPDEFRNWDYEVYGFEVVTSNKISDGQLLHKRTRVLPTVGCEADAVIPEIFEEKVSLTTQDGVVGFEDGSYSRGPKIYSSAAKWENCIVAGRHRVRVIFPELDGSQKTTVVDEWWDQDYCDGAILPGCGSQSQRAVESGAINSPRVLHGLWQVDRTSISVAEGKCVQHSALTEFEPRTAQRRLPMQITLSKDVQEDGGIVLQMEWGYAPEETVVLSRRYNANGELAEVVKSCCHLEYIPPAVRHPTESV